MVGVDTVRAGKTELVVLAAAEYGSPNKRIEIAAEVVLDAVEPGFAAGGGRLDAVAAGASGVPLESAADVRMSSHTGTWAGAAGEDS